MQMTKEHKVMREFKQGKLHSGSKKGPVVKSHKQAVAIAMSEAGKSKYRASAKGSDTFSTSEINKGFKVMCSSGELQRMDTDRLHTVDEFTMASRRNATSGKNRKNLRTSEA